MFPMLHYCFEMTSTPMKVPKKPARLEPAAPGCQNLTNYAMEDPESHTASRRIHIHLFQSPVEILADENGNVSAIRTERTER